MLKRFSEGLQQPVALVGVGIGILAILILTVYGISLTQRAPNQPIEFPHNRHIGLGVQCLYCHPGALRGASAGLPTQTKCWGCHQQLAITQTSELLKPLAEAIKNGKPLQWVPVAQVPDFVHYKHRPHIAAGLNCETCHGDLSRMTIYENPQVLNMGWCLDCHRARSQDDAELRARLLDCGTCHY